jgi:hypothetical protein
MTQYWAALAAFERWPNIRPLSKHIISDLIAIFFYSFLHKPFKPHHKLHQHFKHNYFLNTQKKLLLQTFILNIMKFRVTLLSLWFLATLIAASPVAEPSVAMSNSTFEEKHGCPSQGCPHNSASSILGSSCLEAVYGALIVSLAALV